VPLEDILSKSAAHVAINNDSASTRAVLSVLPVPSRGAGYHTREEIMKALKERAFNSGQGKAKGKGKGKGYHHNMVVAAEEDA
jgi:hypothetical protein